MNKKIPYIVIAILIALLFWRECLHQARRTSLIAYYEEQIDIVIQDTSDELLEACERALDNACSL